ncbi:D-arabinono-1,4-lactone oxidase [Arthrobacter sp. SX1312]|uniref:D-arabinono-1,4-lactone oxidase n=1 Tax=Arthrobacter sp. SX1312 TaxID=2058896 RepID=UPI00215713C1|nr:D-arabinono-1,4-lactone oxidase [Arthrobacter sp. SX1312]
MAEPVQRPGRLLLRLRGLLRGRRFAVRGGNSFLRAVERALAEESGRPHWGKYFDESLYDWPALYPQWEAFRRVRETLDPEHRFANAFTVALLD